MDSDKLKPPGHEQARLAALHSYGILDTPHEPAFDELARLAADVCDAPAALIAFADAERVWLKSQHGIEPHQLESVLQRFTRALRESHWVVVPNATCDPRCREPFSDPARSSDRSFMFFTGAPLLDPEGFALGSLCVLDHAARELSARQAEALRVLSRQVMTQLELRRQAALARVERLEHERNKERLRHERNLSDFAVNAVPGVFYVFDAQGRFLRWNDSVEKVTGYSHAEIAHLHPLDLFEGADKELIAARIGEAFVSGASDAEAVLVAKDGRKIDFYFTGRSAEIDGQPCIIGMGVDITERKRLEAHLREIQRSESIGQLAAGLAHDFNNILLIIQGQTSRLLVDRSLSARSGDAVEQIGLAADRAARLTGQLLMLSRKQVMQVRAVDVNDVLLRVVPLLERLVGEAIELDLQLEQTLPSIRADVGMLEQVLMNLIINARDAMPSSGRVVVRTQAIAIDAAYVAQHPGSHAGNFVRLSVSDTGRGIAPADLPRIFEPFYTTKDIGKGTGLGLAAVDSILKQHQGFIDVESQLGQGSSFHLYLPATPQPANPLFNDSLADGDVSKGSETILVVEDEPSVATMVEMILQDYGYRTLLAKDGRSALDVWSANRPRIDLLLTDLVMPGGISGRELTHRLWVERPELCVIYMSGYTADAIRADLATHSQLRYLQKPYRPQALVRLVRECLDSRV